MKIGLLLLLFVSGLSTPCIAQRCTRDVVLSAFNSDDEGMVFIMVSRAAFREVPVKWDK